MKTANINIYSFNELSNEAKQKAIYEHGVFLDSFPIEYENEDGEMINEYIEHTENDIIESIEANEYLFFKDGTMCSCVTYCGTHPKIGITELKLHGEVYTL